MPAIAGIISKLSAESAQPILDNMLISMGRETLHRQGTYKNESIGLFVGWRCHQGSFVDCIPIWNETRDVCLIFIGENFIENTLVSELKAKGHDFTAGDASYLVHAYEEFGSEFYGKLNGYFSGLLVDCRLKRVTLFNDRYGLQRIYFYEHGSAFYFASEAKCLLRVLPELRQLDMQSFAEFASCGCVLQNRTLFKGLAQLPGGSQWIFSSDQCLEKRSYFRRETWENQEELDELQFYESLKRTLIGILPRYFRDREQLGMSLTGGLDGRIIMAWARADPETLPCYTFGGMYRESRDVTVARRVALACGQRHQVIAIGKEFLSDFVELAEKSVYLSDGNMGVSGAVELYANRIARQIASIRLTGNYGSEILRGHVAFGPRCLEEGVYTREFVTSAQAAAQRYAAEANCHPLSFIAFKQVPWHHYSRFSLEQSQLSARSPYLDNDLVSLVYRAPPGALAGKSASFRLISEGNPALAEIPTEQGILHGRKSVVHAAQRLYTRLTEKVEYILSFGGPPWMSRVCSVIPERLQCSFLGRHYFYHFGTWFRHELLKPVREVLLDPLTRSRPYWIGSRLERLLEDHVTGRRMRTADIQTILSAELLHRTLLE